MTNNFATKLHINNRRQALFSGTKLFPLGGTRGRSTLSVNLGPPHISETTRARKLKFYTHLDWAKYSFQV